MQTSEQYSVRRLLVNANVVPSSPIHVPLMMGRRIPPNRQLLQEPLSVTFQKTVFFIVTAVKTWSYILMPSTHLRLRLPSGLFPTGFLPITYTLSSSLPFALYAPSTSSAQQYNLNYTWRLQTTQLLVLQFLEPPVTLSYFGPNILLSTLFSNTYSRYSSLNVGDRVSCPYRTTGKI
jgi:hypothetical protein